MEKPVMIVVGVLVLGEPIEFEECREGLFVFEGRLALKTQSRTSGGCRDVAWKSDAFSADDGEYWWGSARTCENRGKLMVQPAEWKARG